MKEVNDDHKFLRFQYIWYNNFEVLCSEISLDKVIPECAGTVKAKRTGKYSGFYYLLKHNQFSSKSLDKSDYQITQRQKLVK